MGWTHIGYAQEIRFGAGCVGEAPRILDALRASRALLVTTRRGRESAAGRRLAQALGPRLIATFDGGRPHVPQEVARRAFEQARAERVDAVVSLGGGACSDLGKAVCWFAEAELDAARGRDAAIGQDAARGQDARPAPARSCFDRPALAHLAVPTTYSGAEVTPFFGMLDEAARRKSGAGGPTIAPAGVIYDPELTLDLPPRTSAETGLNALAHCVEAAWSPVRTPEAEAIAYSGAARIFHALPRVVEHPHDLEARTDLLAGAVLAGRALQNASMGVHHGLAQMVGARTGIAHGLANALILAHAVRFNQDAVPEVSARLAMLFGRRDRDAAAALDDLRARIGLPAHLAECGVGRDDIEAVAVMSVANATVAKNPKKVGEADARAILQAAY
ncbi:MAG: iron-containing alcohol dehydrogenase family protein [Steroidobacteraceae bacterium]